MNSPFPRCQALAPSSKVLAIKLAISETSQGALPVCYSGTAYCPLPLSRCLLTILHLYQQATLLNFLEDACRATIIPLILRARMNDDFHIENVLNYARNRQGAQKRSPCYWCTTERSQDTRILKAFDASIHGIFLINSEVARSALVT